MANAHRGEISAELGGKTYVLCLTLGALAELESAFAASNIAGLAARFEGGQLSARDLIRIIGCGLRGAGNVVSDDEAAALKVSGGLPGYVRIAADLISATFGTSSLPDAETGPHPPAPQNA